MSEAPESVGREVLYEKVGEHIAVISLNRPDKRNAVNGALTEAMDYLVKKTESDADIWVVILTSTNDKVFCAGADLSEIAKGNMHLLNSKDGGFAGIADSKRDKPWIAAVRGSALAGGCELSLCCDMIVASDDAKFGLPEVKRGLFAVAGGVHRLPRALPRNIALELVATGDPLDVQRAYELGLVNRVVPPDQVMPTAIGLAEAVTVNAPISVVESLKVARLSSEKSDAELRDISEEAANRVSRTEDFQEGPRAFLEKRPAVWKGR